MNTLKVNLMGHETYSIIFHGPWNCQSILWWVSVINLLKKKKTATTTTKSYLITWVKCNYKKRVKLKVIGERPPRWWLLSFKINIYNFSHSFSEFSFSVSIPKVIAVLPLYSVPRQSTFMIDCYYSVKTVTIKQLSGNSLNGRRV